MCRVYRPEVDSPDAPRTSYFNDTNKELKGFRFSDLGEFIRATMSGVRRLDSSW